MHELLDELDVIECFVEPGKAPIQGEILKKQEQIYRDPGVTTKVRKLSGKLDSILLRSFMISFFIALLVTTLINQAAKRSGKKEEAVTEEVLHMTPREFFKLFEAYQYMKGLMKKPQGIDQMP